MRVKGGKEERGRKRGGGEKSEREGRRGERGERGSER